MGQVVATDSPNEDETNVYPGPEVASRIVLEKNASHISCLLNIRNEASKFLAVKDEVGATWTVNAEAIKDAEATYTAAGVQLRNILDDMPRWAATQSKLEKRYEREAAWQLKMNRLETQERGRPSAIRNTVIRLVELPGGQKAWCCWLGGPLTLGELAGFGRTPAEAAAAFDDIFNNGLPEQNNNGALEQTATGSPSKEG